MLILECSQGCYGRTDGSVNISLRNFVGEGIIDYVEHGRTPVHIQLMTWHLNLYRMQVILIYRYIGGIILLEKHCQKH